jgi:hypothetical protein
MNFKITVPLSSIESVICPVSVLVRVKLERCLVVPAAGDDATTTGVAPFNCVGAMDVSTVIPVPMTLSTYAPLK